MTNSTAPRNAAGLPSVAAVAATGDRPKTLIAQRDALAAAFDNPLTAARDLPALSRELDRVTAEIERLGGVKKGSPLDTARSSRARRDRGRDAAASAGTTSGD